MVVKPVDMRRSFDGLCATITEALGSSPLSGDWYLFRGKRADRIKAIIWDRNMSGANDGCANFPSLLCLIANSPMGCPCTASRGGCGASESSCPMP